MYLIKGTYIDERVSVNQVDKKQQKLNALNNIYLRITITH